MRLSAMLGVVCILTGLGILFLLRGPLLSFTILILEGLGILLGVVLILFGIAMLIGFRRMWVRI